MEKIIGGQVGEYDKKLFTCAHGFAGEGKTTFLLTYPPPLYLLNCGDRDSRSLLAQLPGHYEVYYEWLASDVDALSQPVAAQYTARADALLTAALAGKRGSFLLDGHDLFWEIIQAAKIAAREGTALRFKPANEYAFSFYGRLNKSPLQVGVSAMAQEMWDGPSSTGRFTHMGWKHLDRFLTTDLRVFHKEKMEAGRKPVPVQDPSVTHAGYFEDSKLQEALLRRIIDNPTFALVYKMTFGQAHPEGDKLWQPS